MINHIKCWIAPPTFVDDEEKSHRAKLLNATLIAAFFFMLFTFLSNLISGKATTTVLTINIVVLVSATLLRAWMARGKITQVAIAVIFLGLFLNTAAVISQGSVRAPTTSVFLILIVTAGLLLNL